MPHCAAGPEQWNESQLPQSAFCAGRQTWPQGWLNVQPVCPRHRSLVNWKSVQPGFAAHLDGGGGEGGGAGEVNSDCANERETLRPIQTTRR